MATYKRMEKFKKYLFIFLLAQLFLSYAPAYAQTAATPTYTGVEAQIRQYLCAPSEVTPSQTNLTTGAVTTGLTTYQTYAASNNANSGDLYKCINQLYKFAIVVASVLGVFFIVIGGWIYMSAEGNAESVEKAKSILISTITSLVILFGGYVLLKAINPDLIKFQPIQPPSVVMNTAAWEQWQGSKGLEGSGGGSSGLIGASGTNGCNNCSDYTQAPYNLPGNASQKTGSNTFLNQNLLAKLQNVKSVYSSFVINEAFPPTVNHSSSCHFDGTCVDVGVTSGSTPAELDKLCQAANSAGLKILNEYANSKATDFKVCPAPKTYSTTTGGHLHFY